MQILMKIRLLTTTMYPHWKHRVTIEQKTKWMIKAYCIKQLLVEIFLLIRGIFISGSTPSNIILICHWKKAQPLIIYLLYPVAILAIAASIIVTLLRTVIYMEKQQQPINWIKRW